jgi:hypothetical protein
MHSFHEKFEPRHAPKRSPDRGFGLIMAAFFALVGLSPLRTGHPIRIWSLIVSAAFLVVALTIPSTLRWPNLFWQRLGALLSGIVNPIVISLMFFLVFTPMAFFIRLAGKDPLRLRRIAGDGSYWIPRSTPSPDANSLRTQF